MKMKVVPFVFITLIVAGIVGGCGTDEAALRQMIREEISNERAQEAESFALEKFGFGGALEKEWSHAQGVRAGNIIFVSGQQPYDSSDDQEFEEFEEGEFREV